MEINAVMSELAAKGSDQTKKTFLRHGAKEPLFGVKVGDLKLIQKKTKHDHALALQLFDTRNADAMYFAGLIAVPKLFEKSDLDRWANAADWYMISEYTVAWMAAESRFGWELGNEWILSDKENVATSGWSTLSNLVALKNDADLDIATLEHLLDEVAATIHAAPNRVRHTMNNFVISLGIYVSALTERCKTVGKHIGKVSVNMGDTACKVPMILEYIEKAEKMGCIGQKKKTVVC